MSSSPVPRITTQYPSAEPTIYVAPDFQQVGADTLIGNSATVASLQAEIMALQSRVTALENAARAAGETNP